MNYKSTKVTKLVYKAIHKYTSNEKCYATRLIWATDECHSTSDNCLLLLHILSILNYLTSLLSQHRSTSFYFFNCEWNSSSESLSIILLQNLTLYIILSFHCFDCVFKNFCIEVRDRYLRKLTNFQSSGYNFNWNFISKGEKMANRQTFVEFNFP